MMEEKDIKIHSIKVFDENGHCIIFKLQSHQPIEKLIQEYCTRKNVQMEYLRLRHNGEVVRVRDPLTDELITPASLGKNSLEKSSEFSTISKNFLYIVQEWKWKIQLMYSSHKPAEPKKLTDLQADKKARIFKILKCTEVKE